MPALPDVPADVVGTVRLEWYSLVRDYSADAVGFGVHVRLAQRVSNAFVLRVE